MPGAEGKGAYISDLRSQKGPSRLQCPTLPFLPRWVAAPVGNVTWLGPLTKAVRQLVLQSCSLGLPGPVFSLQFSLKALPTLTLPSLAYFSCPQIRNVALTSNRVYTGHSLDSSLLIASQDLSSCREMSAGSLKIHLISMGDNLLNTDLHSFKIFSLWE